MNKKIHINIAPDGTITMIHDDAMQGLLAAGEPTIKRASHVEPGSELSQETLARMHEDPWRSHMVSQNSANKLMIDSAFKTYWFADMHPSGGAVMGPFISRSKALTAEVEWIVENLLNRVPG